jgi:hypothetical protein
MVFNVNAYLPIAALLSLGVVGIVVGQSNRPTAREPQFKELSAADRARLDRQRAIIASEAKARYGTPALTRTQRDLPVIQKLIADMAFKKTQTYELQSLGVVFGDVLTNELPLRWVMVMDEFGTDPTLRFKNTTLQVNALTMISKRVEQGERVNVSNLLRSTREHISNSEKEFR